MFHAKMFEYSCIKLVFKNKKFTEDDLKRHVE